MSFIAAHSRDPVLNAKIHSSVTAPKIIHSDDEAQPLLGPIARNDLDSTRLDETMSGNLGAWTKTRPCRP